MKKITFSLLLLLTIMYNMHAQVQIGEGTNQFQNVPFEPYYGYSYGQSIYLANEINATGTITSIRWFYSGGSMLTNSQQVVIYMGHTDKSSFDSQTDFIGIESLTQVYSGGIPVTGPGWITLTLTTPFTYNGNSNLIVAVDENQDGYGNSSDDFLNTAVTHNRSICVYSDTVNPSPADPTNTTGNPERSIAAFVPTVVFGGISQTCLNVTGLTAADISTTTANLSWQAGGPQTTWEVLVLESGSQAPTPSNSGIPITGMPAYQATSMNPSSSYTFYVRTDCGGGFYSGWSAGYNFVTQCNPFPAFQENFDNTNIAVGAIPPCWGRIKNTPSIYAYVGADTSNASSSPKSISLNNVDDPNAQLFLITPPLANLSANTHKIKFKAMGNSGYDLLIGTMSNPTDPNTFTLVQTIALTDNYVDYSVILNTSTTDAYIAFKHGLGGTYRTIRIDDVIWEARPAVAPQCVSNVNVTVHESCGNLPTLLTWNAVEEIDGYKISIGTAPSGDYIVNNVDIGNAISYSFIGNPNTTYYYYITAYNLYGTAIGCTEATFTTDPQGCFCPSQPTSNDGLGITNVKIAASDFAVNDVMYYNFSGDATINLTQGITNTTLITFATSYTYDTNIWIDFNNNSTFEASEKVYSGMSLTDSPTILDASFLMPLTATLGEHRMRIGSANSGQFPPNPCYSGPSGVTLDFLVNILPLPACLPSTGASVSFITTNTALLNWTSSGTLFNIEYGTTATTLGEGNLISGLTGNSHPLVSLAPQTDYRFYIQTDCGSGSSSPWAGPFLFRTACEAFGDFEDDFTTSVNMNAPDCWLTSVVSSSTEAYVRLYNYSDSVHLYTADDASANLLLITPILSALPSGAHRIRFKAMTYNPNATLIVGTMTDPTIPSTFTPISTINLSGTFTEYNVPFTNTTDNHVAFKHGGGGSNINIYIDDVIWELTPTVLPNCITDLETTINMDCGNFPSLMEWTAVENADGYRITLGTSPEGNNVLNNLDLGNVVATNFTGNYNTTYYYTITPYNLLGSAEDCSEGTFTTASTGCYCTSVPTSNDNLGITTITINNSEFENSDVTYTDFTGNEMATIYQGETANVQVHFATSYAYKTYIFIDLNNNYVFEPSEQLFAGEPLSGISTVFDAPFTLPSNAPLGIHRMRLVTYYYNPTPAIGNPCYSGSSGVTADFNVNIETTMTIKNLDTADFKAYPNPVSDILNLSYTQEITNVAVFNILGQQVIAATTESPQEQIDMSNLAAGAYWVKVSTGNGAKTIKVIKK